MTFVPSIINTAVFSWFLIYKMDKIQTKWSESHTMGGRSLQVINQRDSQDNYRPLLFTSTGELELLCQARELVQTACSLRFH